MPLKPLQTAVAPRRTSLPPSKTPERHPDAHRYTFLFLTLVVPSVDQVNDPLGHVREVQNRIDELRAEQVGLTFLYFSVLVYGFRPYWVYLSQMPFQCEPMELVDLTLEPGCALHDAVGTALEHAVDILECNKNGPRVRYRAEVWETDPDRTSTQFELDGLKKLLQKADSFDGFDGLLLPENGSLYSLLIAK